MTLTVAQTTVYVDSHGLDASLRLTPPEGSTHVTELEGDFYGIHPATPRACWEQKRALLNPQSEDFGSTSDPWGQGDPLENVSNTELQSQQQQILDEQDRGLDALSRVIGRQKQMAIDIGNEVDSQNEIIDDITDHVDGTTSRLKRETRHIAIVDRKSGSCGYYIVIVLLFVVIIVIVAVPYNGKPTIAADKKAREDVRLIPLHPPGLPIGKGKELGPQDSDRYVVFERATTPFERQQQQVRFLVFRVQRDRLQPDRLVCCHVAVVVSLA
ncbi:hypothetical protein C0Q70_01104 [Pomacea canaliculata]|uniref:Syntaxin-8 n=1 Tax=Pomacea canaliculata TaxID=400727 RepID=A0A2T7PYK6_POMCA|nr:hypothetical protein C0Q70_01104 [Pomacea canaliculata]